MVKQVADGFFLPWFMFNGDEIEDFFWVISFSIN